jgi:hypothetical protein
VVGRAGIPAAIVGRLNAVINESLKSPDVAATLAKLAVDERDAGRVRIMTTTAPVIKATGLQGVE